MNARLLLLLLLPLLTSASHVTAQQPWCLHGTGESDAQRVRKRQALTFARHVNTLENVARQANGTYVPLRQLAGLNSSPDGFEMHAAIEPLNYVFAIKDRTDPCGFAYFSDESGQIYSGEALR